MPNNPAYYVRDPSGTWLSTSWADYAEQTVQVAQALVNLGVGHGDKVCILGFNRPEWAIFDLAAMMIGAVPAGIYTTCSPEEVQYIIEHSESKVVLLEDQGQWAKVDQERAKLPALNHVVMMQGTTIDDDLAMTWEAFLKLGLIDAGSRDVVMSRLAAIQPEDLATFIYTSGTTGPPKGVMLTHDNLMWTANVARDMIALSPEDSNVSYLPLSHIAEQMFTLHCPITVGYQVYFAQSIEAVAQNLQEVQPSIVFAVPRVWEKFHAKVSTALGDLTGLKRFLIHWAVGVGGQVTDLKNRGQDPSGLLALQYRFADKLLSKLRTKIGLGGARICVTGAAPISKEILEFFGGLDLQILEVYGQSEDAGPTSFNLPGKTRFGTVGPPIPGVEVRIAADDEILVKGRNVFEGYYKDPEATASTLQDGWLYSGDLGKIDDEGFLHITGRKKEIIITAGGKNIAPKNIEAALKDLTLVSQAVVIGDRRKYLSALITLDADAAERFASENNLDPADLHANPALIAEIQRGVDTSVNPRFARVEHVRKFCVLHRDFDVAQKELTPTLKIKRRIIHATFADQIESMYVGA
jgi:long-chain acyl-CoA synthetase